MKKPQRISYTFFLSVFLLLGGAQRTQAFAPFATRETTFEKNYGPISNKLKFDPVNINFNLKSRKFSYNTEKTNYNENYHRDLYGRKKKSSTILKSNSFNDVIRLHSPNSNVPLNESGVESDGDSLLSSNAPSPSSSALSQDSSFASTSSTTTVNPNRSGSLKSTASISSNRIDANINNEEEKVDDFQEEKSLKDGKQDSFRPSKEPLEPFIINLLIKIFETGEDAERIVNKNLRARRRRYSQDLTLEDCNIIRKRVFGTIALQLRLAYILEKAVKKSGTLDQKYGFKMDDFGLPMPSSESIEDKKEDPLLLLHRAECLLAAYMLTEDKDSKVEFLESDKLDLFVKNLDLEAIESDEFYNDLEDDAERISKRRSMPIWIVKRYIEEFGVEGADLLCTALNVPSKTVVRINPEKSSRQNIARALIDSNDPSKMDIDYLRKSAVKDSHSIPLEFQSSFQNMKFNNLENSQGSEIDDKEKIETAKGTIFESLIPKAENSESTEKENKKLSIIETKYSPWGLLLENRQVPLTSLELFRRGWIDIMNEASQCSVLASGAKPWDIVLIYGSKTGVKAHAMASLMRENGMVYCFDEYDRQVHQLKSRIERFGTTEMMEIIPDVNAARRIRADVVFVDAICSNSGVFNHHPSMRYRKREEDLVNHFIPKQKEMLMNAATSVAPGGILVYTTCSLFREENQDIAEWFINSEHGVDFEPEIFDAKGHMRLLAPHIHGSTMDGTFICRWRRKQLDE